MDQVSGNSASWQDGETWESTAEPIISVSAMAKDAPTLTVATIIGVTVVVLVAIVVVFLLGVLIDCRQQKMLEKKMGEVKRSKSHRRVSAHPEGDVTSIVNNMEEPELSVPPAEALRTIP
ncbi:uncharacterized protein LOC126367601 [Pectinophora gossypiella]|uniref:Uncharacterized protein n=1 Tax=Pectinophora gossypiella TaxID=13191 RepID=A0A1E1W805_PECGO|nr:uncharacterized protein LOC126367601 [Pectinophora gossypiella]XP_049867153.1 uncharacterized protein LOC126367601 [Pectinophora gossypiella]